MFWLVRENLVRLYTFRSIRYMGFLSMTTLLFLVLTLAFGMFLAFRAGGKRLYAIGGNPEVARLAGVRVSLLSIGVYGVSGALAGLAGIVLNSRLLSSQPYGAQGYELNVILSRSATLTGSYRVFSATSPGRRRRKCRSSTSPPALAAAMQVSLGCWRIPRPPNPRPGRVPRT